MRATGAIYGTTKSLSFASLRTVLVRTTLAFGSATSASGAAHSRFRLPFPLPLPAFTLSFAARFARASSRSSYFITFALPRTSDLVDRRTLASLLISDKNLF
jgi:hypothetical protein